MKITIKHNKIIPKEWIRLIKEGVDYHRETGKPTYTTTAPAHKHVWVEIAKSKNGFTGCIKQAVKEFCYKPDIIVAEFTARAT